MNDITVLQRSLCYLCHKFILSDQKSGISNQYLEEIQPTDALTIHSQTVTRISYMQ